MDAISRTTHPAPFQGAGDFVFVPLGGTGEIGMNLNLYGCQGAWIAVDCGMGFAGPELPEAEILLPDPAFIAARRDDLRALIITHAHEDHIGAVVHLWRRLGCPVYATRFAAAVLRRKLAEAELLGQVKLKILEPGQTLDLAPFSLRFIPVTHSTPEAQALAIRTPLGTVLHTGDWKFDPDPQVGQVTDEAALAAIGAEGVLAMISDSTNAMVEGHSGSEAEVARSLRALIAGIQGRIAITCFASNIARVRGIFRAAEAAGRHVALVGRSLHNYVAAAQEAGYLEDLPDFVPEEDIGSIPDDNLLLLVTGSQGEPRAALSRIAADSHRFAVLGEGDTVIYSSRVIPGNERAIGAVQGALSRRGVRVMTADDHHVHCSGHPARDEIRKLYRLVKPKYVVPTHGEWTHLAAQAALAREEGITPILLEDGDVLRLGPGAPEVTDSAETGRLVVDGGRLVPLRGEVMAARKRMLFNGIVVGSLAVDKAGKLKGLPRISAPGLFEDDDATLDDAEDELAEAIADLPAKLRVDDDALEDATRAALRRIVGKKLGKRPIVAVHLLRV
jgi:ribonuclease J